MQYRSRGIPCTPQNANMHALSPYTGILRVHPRVTFLDDRASFMGCLQRSRYVRPICGPRTSCAVLPIPRALLRLCVHAARLRHVPCLPFGPPMHRQSLWRKHPTLWDRGSTRLVSARCSSPTRSLIITIRSRSHLDAFNRIGSCCIHTTTHTPERKSPSWRGGDVQLAVKNASLYGWEWVGTRQQTGVEMVRNQIGSSTARARRASA